MNDMTKNIVLWVIIAIVLMTVFNSFTAQKTNVPQMDYSEFMENVKSGNIKSVLTKRGIKRF